MPSASAAIQQIFCVKNSMSVMKAIIHIMQLRYQPHQTLNLLRDRPLMMISLAQPFCSGIVFLVTINS